jgi:hypothetical protein
VNPYKDGKLEEVKEENKDPYARTPFREIDEVISNPDLPMVPARPKKKTTLPGGDFSTLDDF